MAKAIAIVGDTGTGKTSSIMPFEEGGIIGLDPKETFIINIKDKPLPMRGWQGKYIPIKPGVAPTEGNYFASADAQEIIKVISYVGSNRPDIKNIVLDDKCLSSLNSVNCWKLSSIETISSQAFIGI